MSNYKFETLQLHVGQEQADPATDSPCSAHLPDHFLCVPQQPARSRPLWSGQMPATSTAA